MSGEQLERSILERKERGELHAIAEAMSLKPGSRSKKADLIDQILQATGIGGEGGAAATNGHSTKGSGTGTGSRRNGTRAAAQAAKDSAESQSLFPAGTASTGGADSAAGIEDGAVAAAPKRRTRRAAAVAETAPAASEGSPNGASAPSNAEPAIAAAAPPATARSSNAAPTDGEGAGVPASGGAGRSARAAEAAAHAGDAQQAARTDPVAVTTGEWSDGVSVDTVPQARPQRGPGHGSQSQTSGEPGNRRSRRRRGRERGTGGTGGGGGGGERGPGGQELQGGSQEAAWQGELVPVKGLLDLREEGYGFLRTSGYLPSQRDVYVSVSQARRFALRRGDAIEGACRPAGPTEKYPALIRIDSICGLPTEDARRRPKFEDLTPLFPDSRLKLEMPGDPANVTARIVDLISPIGKGQRGMMVSPPKAGKTTVMKQIAHSIEENNPDVHLMVLLVDERPEEATDWRRSVKGEVIASTFDRPAEEHVTVAELSIERAKRLVEMGKDVVIILDGITRLARAYNLGQPASGRIMSGGVDSGALYPPKKFFGAARNIEEGGSLTILATALVETGSRMDEVIFEEFKGTGNMELRLDRKLSERRLYPAIDVNASSTRHEELLFDRGQLQQVWKLRRVLNAIGQEGNAAAGLELLMDKIRTTRSNDEFLAEIAKAPTPGA
jgi:transcription termination factor Rho